MKKAYDALILEAGVMSHQKTMVTDSYGEQRKQHVNSCKKCSLVKQASNMEIQIHEWPLPSDGIKAKSVVFELELPSNFRHWRDGTNFLRKRVLGPRSNLGTSNSVYSQSLNDYPALTRFRPSDPDYAHQRVMPASTTKPNAITHRSGKKISESREDQVCLSNGMNWHYFDTENNIFINNFGPDVRIAEDCTFLVPPPLKGFLHRPWNSPDGPGPNNAVASQSLCPNHLSLDEFKALWSLPLGHKIIWENLLREFAMPSVDWRKVETALFALQISHQTGPFSFDSDLRSSHVGLEDEALVQKLVGEMGLSLNRLKENWESVPAVATLIMSLTRRILQAALVCTQCYDIDATYLDLTLRDSEALSQFIQCSIAIQECYGKHEDDTKQAEKSFLDCLILRYRRLLFRTKKILMSQITSQGNKGLDSAIAKIWPSFRRSRGDQWIEQASCWLKTTTSNQDGTVKVPVHYNVITAELLVKGLPLDRLPPKYEAQKDYTILFGRSSVDVMPSAEAAFKDIRFIFAMALTTMI
ncbi:unnamed protein product [Clonostachys chloroleuca]|uniref:Uncharacterized protein n=1 Tax=Clonostachys chloroleuca TaxID=1926264 RepID=A0AA35LUR7_9HYPO|nr:unnamed protein product [Clonostachys chloroleuca]